MKNSFLAVSMIIACSCNPGNKSERDVSGIYVRQYLLQATHLETGDTLGMAQVMDTIFVESERNDYKVSVRKWRLNDYDQRGWEMMVDSVDKPVITYYAFYDEVRNTLSPKGNDVSDTLYFDTPGNNLFRTRTQEAGYAKVKSGLK